MNARIRPRPPAGGFTLIELVIATTIGAMLLVAVAEVVQLIGQDRETVVEDADWRLEQCLARLTDETRRAWVVQEPEPDVLLLTDARGRRTRYELDRGAHALRVTRHDGATGTMISGVEDFDVETQAMTRYRDARPLESRGAWWERSADVELEPLPIEAGLRVALGFTLAARAPDWVHTQDGVTEQTLGATLDHIVLPLAFAPPLPETDAAEAPGDERSEVRRGPPAEGTLFVDLHEAFAPGDARPYGPSLGSVGVPVGTLPAASWTWTSRGESAALSFGRGASGSTVALQHVPPGNPAGGHTLHVTSNAVASHLEHGDVLGPHGDASDDAEIRVLAYAPPAADVTLDLSCFGARIRPGRAYTLVFRLSGAGAVLMAGHPLGSRVHSEVAAADQPGGAFSALDFAVPFSLDGLRTFSQTTAHPVIHAISVSLGMLDGETRATSASVVSQTAVEDPWRGCVPGEFPGLERADP